MLAADIGVAVECQLSEQGSQCLIVAFQAFSLINDVAGLEHRLNPHEQFAKMDGFINQIAPPN